MRSLKWLALCAGLAVVILGPGESGQVGLGQGICTVTLSSAQSIQAAISAAPTNAVICLGEGTWQEDLTVTKGDLTLRGRGPSKSAVTGWLEIEVAGRLTLEDLRIRRNSPATTTASGTGCTVTLTAGQSIQSAIDGAPAGAVICLGASTYTEELAIRDKLLVLRGAGSDQTILDGSTIKNKRQEGGVEVLGSSQVTIEGLTVRNFAADPFVHDGLLVQDSAQVVIQNAQFSGNSDNGIWVLGLARVRILNSVIKDNVGVGIAVIGLDSLLECRGNAVTNNSRGDFQNKSGANEAVAERCK